MSIDLLRLITFISHTRNIIMLSEEFIPQQINEIKRFRQEQIQWHSQALYIGELDTLPAKFPSSTPVSLLCVGMREHSGQRFPKGCNLFCVEDSISPDVFLNLILELFQALQEDGTQQTTRDISALLKLHDVQAMVDLSSNIVNNPVFLTSGNHKVLASSKSTAFLASHWRSILDSGYFPFSAVSDYHWRKYADRSRGGSIPVIVDNSRGEGYSYILRVLSHKGKILGHLVMVCVQGSCNQYLDQMELFARLLYPELLSNETSSSKGSGLSSILSDLLEYSNLSQDTIYNLLLPYAWTPKHFCFVVCFSYVGVSDQPLYEQLLHTMPLPCNSCSLLHRNRPVAILSTDLLPEQFQSEYAQLIHFCESHGLFLSVSRWIDTLRDLSLAYRQALFAYRFGERTAQPGDVYLYDELWIYDLISSCSNIPKLQAVCMPTVAQLMEYDRAHNGTLVQTLACYLKNDRNLTATAKELFLHRNTVKYRIERCVEILHVNLNSANVASGVSLSLMILNYLNETKESGRRQLEQSLTDSGPKTDVLHWDTD